MLALVRSNPASTSCTTAHLTNYSVNKLHVDSEAPKSASKWSLPKLRQWLSRRGVDVGALWRAIDAVCAQVRMLSLEHTSCAPHAHLMRTIDAVCAQAVLSVEHELSARPVPSQPVAVWRCMLGGGHDGASVGQRCATDEI